MSKLYNENSIESLSPLEFTRLRAGVYCGSTEYSTQLLIEIFSNAVDEFNAGHGDTIEVKIKNNKFTVTDNGQGFLTNTFRNDGKSILEASFSVLNTSGKFHDDGSYDGVSTGLNGIGSKLAVFLSNTLKVTTYRDNKYETCWFKEGIFEKREVGEKEHTSGTTVEWTPSQEFFTNVGVEIPRIKELFETTSCLCPGLTIKLDNNGEKTKYLSKKGLVDLANKEIKDKEILKHRLIINTKKDKYKLDLVMSFTSDYSTTIIPYVNTGLTERGIHLTQIKTIITREFNTFYKDKGWLKAKDNNLSGDEIQEGMYLIFNMVAPGVAYDAQTKGNVVKLDAKPILDIFTEELKTWLINNSKEIKALADKAINARKAKEAAKKARDAARDAGLNGGKKIKNIDLPSKLADCWSKDREKCELFIVEGDSAAGGMKTARNTEYSAIMPIRGKIINTYKASVEQLTKNAEIADIIKALGLELDTENNKLIFNEKKLRYGKVLIASDADVDGSHITSLIYTLFWSYCPELIEKGFLYKTVPPLYKITTKNGYKYLLNDKALEEYKSSTTEQYTVGRLKGLGESSAEELEEYMFNENTREIKQITVQDIQEAEQLFNDLMGKEVNPRKDFIQKYSNEYKGGV